MTRQIRVPQLALTLVIMVTLSACSGAGDRRLDASVRAAPGVDVRRDAVDGLTVGHRLMDAGEYELALKAYYRAAADRGLDADTLSALGSVNLRLGRLGQAERLLRQAVEIDENFAPAWNNLGVVLMESGQLGEAERVFRTAFAVDNGESPHIRENLRLVLAKLENPGYGAENNTTFALVRRGRGEYQLHALPS